MRLALVIPLALAGSVAAQTVAPNCIDPRYADPTGNPVEPMTADLASLQISIRKVERGLAEPTTFDQVFRYGDGFMRAQGGLYAVFDSSVYAKDTKKNRLMPVVPPGTMFYIGPPPDPAAKVAPPLRPGQVDNRVSARIAAQPVTNRSVTLGEHRVVAVAPAAPGAILADPEYRAKRLRSLMKHAVQQSERVSAEPAADQAAVGRSSSPSSK